MFLSLIINNIPSLDLALNLACYKYMKDQNSSGKMGQLDVYMWILAQNSPQCEYMMVLSPALS